MQSRPEAFDERVIDRRGDAAHRAEQPGLPEPVPEEPAGVLRAGSAWTTVPGSGRRRQRAISSASTTISAVIRSEIDQPTMRREYASITAAQ